MRAVRAGHRGRAVVEEARRELAANVNKKTKTIAQGDAINRVPFHAWVGYSREAQGGMYYGDREKVGLWRFPERIPRAWERAG